MKHRKIQIGIIGSMADKKLSKVNIKLAHDIGQQIANNNAILLFGFEGDHHSVSEMAALSAEKHGGLTVAFLWGKTQKLTNPNLKSLQVSTGQIRGGGRELALVLSSDAIISISGGAGTLTEIAFAYQANVPLIALSRSGGWSTKLAGTHLDNRNRSRIIPASSANQAVNLAIQETKRRLS